ncbi:Asp-tRNA(Asn)/Glu-tRNA(Gln) amidotransferase subunit GatC [bacterium]|nr:Asp-tRNA(Asn)/Glu-tRNA(Gln) amidotransferase subunit GatC [bacterium]
MLSKEEVKHVARLARIKLTEEEMQKMQGELVKILDYIEKLKELDVENLEPTTHSILIKNVFREDKPEEKSKEEGEKLIQLAPQQEGRFIKIKSVFK